MKIMKFYTPVGDGIYRCTVCGDLVNGKKYGRMRHLVVCSPENAEAVRQCNRNRKPRGRVRSPQAANDAAGAPSPLLGFQAEAILTVLQGIHLALEILKEDEDYVLQFWAEQEGLHGESDGQRTESGSPSLGYVEENATDQENSNAVASTIEEADAFDQENLQATSIYPEPLPFFPEFDTSPSI